MSLTKTFRNRVQTYYFEYKKRGNFWKIAYWNFSWKFEKFQRFRDNTNSSLHAPKKKGGEGSSTKMYRTLEITKTFFLGGVIFMKCTWFLWSFVNTTTWLYYVVRHDAGHIFVTTTTSRRDNYPSQKQYGSCENN